MLRGRARRQRSRQVWRDAAQPVQSFLVMVEGGHPRKTGEPDAGNSPESEVATPSSRLGLALVATDVGEHTDSLQKTVQPGGN